MASLARSGTELEEVEIAGACLGEFTFAPCRSPGTRFAALSPCHASEHAETDETLGASGDRLHVLVEKRRARQTRSPPPRAHYRRCDSCGAEGAPGAETGGHVSPGPPESQKKNKMWKSLRDECGDCIGEQGPAMLELYPFECGSAQYMSTAGAAAPGPCERLSGRVAHAATDAVMGTVGAVLALPVALILAVQSAVLRGARALAAGCAQHVSDYVLKPALAVAYNAALRPLLLFGAQVAGAAREALQPMARAGADCAEPVARLLSAVRLVEVRVSPRCSCHCSCRTELL